MHDIHPSWNRAEVELVREPVRVAHASAWSEVHPSIAIRESRPRPFPAAGSALNATPEGVLSGRTVSPPAALVDRTAFPAESDGQDFYRDERGLARVGDAPLAV